MSKYPDKKLAILSCMDTASLSFCQQLWAWRTEMPSSSRTPVDWLSVLSTLPCVVSFVAIYELGVGNHGHCHSNCGACPWTDSRWRNWCSNVASIRMLSIPSGFAASTSTIGWRDSHDTEDSVRNTINTIRTHPLVPKMSIFMVISLTHRRANWQKWNRIKVLF